MAALSRSALIEILPNKAATIDVICVGEPSHGFTRPHLEYQMQWSRAIESGHDTDIRVFRYVHQPATCKQDESQYLDMDSIDDAARRLLSEYGELTSERADFCLETSSMTTSLDSRPVIFVCYGLGGVIVKQTLLMATLQCETHALLCQTQGIVFHETPHTVDSKGWANKVHAICDFVIPVKHWEKFEHLAEISRKFQDVSSLYITFNLCRREWDECSEAEVLHSDCLWATLCPNKTSESRDRHVTYPHAITTPIPMYLEQMIHAVKQRQRETKKFQKMQDRILERHKATRLSGTCQWLFAMSKYKEWLHEKGPSCLWVHGAPGTGKSVLASMLVEEMQKSKKLGELVIPCFVDDSYETTEYSQLILRTLVCQLGKQGQPETSDLLLESKLRNGEISANTIPLSTFQHHLRRILSSIDVDVRITFVFDGLDLNEGIKSAVLREIISANTSHRRLKCCISSRTPCHPGFLSSHIMQVDISREPGFQRDLTGFVSSRLSAIGSTTSRRWQLPTPDQLRFRARGNFLWLDLIIRSLHQWLPQDISNGDVRRIPGTINEIYQEILQKSISHNAELARMVFSWLVAACRPLTVQELTEAVAISKIPTSSADTISGQLDVSEICGPLVTVTHEGTLQLIHSSVREYLLSNQTIFSARYPLREAHALLAQTCLSYLSNKSNAAEDAILGASVTQTGITPITSSYTSSLLDYAQNNWMMHYGVGETVSNLLPGMLQCRLNSAFVYICEKLDIPRRRRPEIIKQTALRFCSLNGFVTLAEIYLQMGTSIDRSSCEYCLSPLELATRKNYPHLVALFLKGRPAISSRKAINLGTMLLEAVVCGSMKIIGTLLEHGAAVNSREKDSHMTPLHCAALSGRLDCTKLLVESGADMNAMTSVTKETPLHLAALHGHSQVVEFLLRRQRCTSEGVGIYDSIVQQSAYRAFSEDVMNGDGDGSKPVWEIDERSSAERELWQLESYTHLHVTQRNHQGQTPLHLAASNGYDAATRLLIENGASSEIYDHNGLTALQLAVKNGRLTVVKLMLTAGANHKAGARNWGLILGQAMSKGYHSVASLMLWLFYTTELSGKPIAWSVLCLAVESERNTARETLQKVRSRTKQSTRSQYSNLALRPAKSENEGDVNAYSFGPMHSVNLG